LKERQYEKQKFFKKRPKYEQKIKMPFGRMAFLFFAFRRDSVNN